MMRTVKNPSVRRSELIACAQKLFFTKGYERTSIRDIVDGVGVAKGTFYYYFDSKVAILEALSEAFVAQSVVLLDDILANEALSALEKWGEALRVVGGWKRTHKAELIEMFRVIYQDENVLLRYKFQRRVFESSMPVFAEIIAQGVAEGVFDVSSSAEETAEVILALMYGMRDAILLVALYPEQHENGLEVVQGRYVAMQAAVERILGVAPGSFPLIDRVDLDAWFA